MSKLIAVWGSPDSGKTSFAVKLASAVYERYNSTVLVLACDHSAPVLPQLFHPKIGGTVFCGRCVVSNRHNPGIDHQ